MTIYLYLSLYLSDCFLIIFNELVFTCLQNIKMYLLSFGFLIILFCNFVIVEAKSFQKNGNKKKNTKRKKIFKIK